MWICSVNHLRGLVVASAHRRGKTMAADEKNRLGRMGGTPYK
jgi:hypothetical protein